MIKTEIKDNIVIATLEYGKTNSVTMETLEGIRKIVDDVNKQEELLGIVLTGAGKMFSSGFDLPMFLNLNGIEEVIEFFKLEEEIMHEFFTCSKPVVSAINGHCVAAGVILSCAADYRIVTNHPKIKIGMSEIKIGLPLSVAQAAIVRFGLNDDRTYRDVMYFANMYNVDQAKELGIVDEIVEADQLIPRAMELVKMWINTPGRPFIKIKELARKEVADRIKVDIANADWNKSLACFQATDVRQTLEFIQSTMA